MKYRNIIFDFGNVIGKFDGEIYNGTVLQFGRRLQSALFRYL